jgi:hypothetical protein
LGAPLRSDRAARLPSFETTEVRRMPNVLLPITEAEETIDQRKQLRETQRPENRTHLALETIADEMTRMRAELSVLRSVVAGMAGAGRRD